RTPWFSRGREEAHISVATSTFHCPEDALELLRAKPYPYESRETADAERALDITTYMTEGYALGSATKPFAAGERPEIWPGFNSILLHAQRDDGAPVVLSARYILNDNCSGPIEPTGATEPQDCWDDGQFAAAQHRNRAIVAYGMMPRLRPITSAKLSVRILGSPALPQKPMSETNSPRSRRAARLPEHRSLPPSRRAGTDRGSLRYRQAPHHRPHLRLRLARHALQPHGHVSHGPPLRWHG